MKQMMRKLFALLMAAMMLCGSLPLDALAEESENTRTDYSETGTIYDQIGDDLLDQDGTPKSTAAPTVFALELTRPEGAPLYGTMNEDYVFDYAIEGCAAETCALSWRVEFAGEEPETGVIADDIAVENGAATGEFTYQPKQEGVYRLTMAAAIPENSELVAEDQLALVVVDPEKKEYLCGKEEHTHTDACYAMAQGGDDSGPGIEVDGVFESLQAVNCPVGYEHTHIDACLPQCGQISHTHVEECKDADGNLICGLEEHTHGPECLGEQPENVEGADETDLNAIINGNTYKLDGGTYKLTNHLTTTDIIKIDGDVTINLYDYNITRQAPASGKMGYVFQLDNTEDKLTIKGNGTITNNANDMFHVDNGTLVLEGGTFTGCSADTIYANNAKVTMEDGVTITGNTNYSPVYARTGTVLIMNGGEIKGNTVNKAGEKTNVGGGVKLNGATFTMTGGEISGNTAGVSGGGVYVENSKFTMTGGTITRNNATVNHGGGVYLIGSSSFDMTGGEISNNIAKQYGGGVYFAQDSTGSLTMTNSKIADNTAGVGGGVYLNKGVSFAMNGGEISGNTTTDTSNGSGGGVYFAAGSTGSFTMDGGKITGNKTATSQNGGGLYFNGNNKVEIKNATISENTAGYGGGGIYFAQGYNGTFTMTGSTVTGNNAQQGGGVCVQNIDFTISGGEISHNTAKSTTETGYSGSGGGIFCTNCGTVTLKGGLVIDDNTAGNTTYGWVEHGNGGGVYFEKCGTVTVDDITVSNNKATAAGGGLAFDNSNKISITNAHINKNTSNGKPDNKTAYCWGGGGIVTLNANGGQMTIQGTEINGNVSGYRNGGGMFIGEKMNVTISGTSYIKNNKTNTTEDWGGGGIFVNQGGSLTIENALITGNHADGFGGGVAGCSTGKNHLVYDGGAGIYENTAAGTNLSGKTSAKPEDHILKESGKILTGDGKDYFCADYSDVSGVMLGGGNPKWSGKADNNPVTIPYGERASASDYMVLNSDPSEADKNLAAKKATVFIEGNTSNIHGGGIMNNGVLFLGNEEKVDGTGYAPQVKKEIKGDSAPERTFTFKLSNKAGEEIGTVTVTGAGTARFDVIDYDRAGEYTYTIKEEDDSADDDEWEYDSSEWTVTVKVEPDGNGKLVASATYSKNESSETSTECATFTNTYTPKGDLTVSKTVTGNAGDTEKLFNFRVELSDTSISDTYGTGDTAMTFKDGVAEFTLKDGQSKTATGLPAGITYTVSETEANTDGYTTSSTGATGSITKGATATAAFTNAKNTGDLTVSKTVTGEGDRSKSFNFRVELSDKSITGTYHDMTFSSGVAEFTLKHGESKTATGLPAGITYSVTETEASQGGYTTTSEGASGNIPANGTAKAEFTNHMPEPETGSLVVSKTVTGVGDTNRAFNFTVELSDKTIAGTYGDMTFEGGVAKFTLKHGESKTATDLPAGITYIVTETEANEDGYTTTPSGDTGEINDGETAKAEFVNYKPAPEPGNLTVSKTVTGAGDTDRAFNFTVELSDKTIAGTYGDMTFTGGKAEFTLKHGESKTATGLPAGITYTVSETEADQDGYTTTSEGASGNIPENGTAKAEFTNDKPAPKTGNLTVSKTVTGAGNKSQKFSFTVELSDTTISGTYGDMEFNKGVATFSLAHGESATATGLPAGITYTVRETEADKDGYTTKSTGATGTIPENGTATAEFTNDKPAPETGNLTVSKTVAGAGDTEKEFNFTVELTGEAGESISGTYGGMTFTNGVAHFTLKHNESVTATGLPVGVEYTVTETEADQDGYKTTYTDATGEITENGHATAAFTNTRETGGLTVKKTVAGRGGEKSRDFHFTVTLDDASISGTYGGMTFDDNGIAEFTLRDGQHRKATGLPVGVGYTVTETRDDGYTTTYSGIAGINPAGPAKGTIAEGDPAEVTVTNTRKLGGLIVKKLVEGEDAESSKEKEFNFTVELSDKTINGTYFHMSFTNGVAKFTLKNGETRTATELPAGVEYTVTEERADGYSTTYSGATGTIEENKTAEVTVTNTRETGDLRVTKHVVGDDSESSKKFDFTVTLSDETINGQYFHMQFTNGVAKFTLGNGETRTATGLPVGTKYTVEETGAAGYQVTYTGETGEITAGTRSEAVFTNTREKGNLSVTKTVEGVDGDRNKEFAFTVKLVPAYSGTFGQMEFKDGVAEFTLKHGEMMTATGLPIGTEYTVTETDNEGYTVSETGATGTIASDTPRTAAFTNTRKTGDLAVTKTVTGEGGDKTKAFNFTVTLDDASINGEYGGMEFTNGSANFTLKDGQTMRATGLPAGVKYTVTEDDYSSEGYTTSVGDGDKTRATGGTILANGTATAAFKNDRPEPETGRLKVTKSVTGTGGDKTKEFNFTVTLSDTSINGEYGSMTFVNGVAMFTLMDGWSKTASGLPVGVKYTVTEAEANQDGYTTKSTGATGTILADITAEAAFVNDRPEPKIGGLTVTKTVTGVGDKTKEFNFTVTLGDASINGEYGGMTFESGEATFKLKHGQSLSASGLPAGVTYTVTEAEANQDGYTTTYSGATGKIEENKTAKVTVTNEREIGGLSVTKTVTGKGGDASKEFHFTVRLNDASINGQYGVMIFTNGVASVTLKSGERATASGLPAGVGYTVTEAEADADGYTTSATGATGTIPAGGNAEAAFVNDKPEPDAGSLTVTKTVTGEGGDKTKAFHFTVTLGDKTINGTYGDMEFTNGVASFTLTNGQSATASGLPVGVSYTVVETEANKDNYTTSSTGTSGTIPKNGDAMATFVNDRPAGETVSRTVRKIWIGDENNTGVRPYSIQVQLYQNGAAYGSAVTLYAGNSWEHTWTDLPAKDANGAAYRYTVVELAQLRDYTTSYSGDTFTITNTYTPPVTRRTVRKIWADVDNLDGSRPASVVVQLTADGRNYGQPVTLYAGNNWSYTWTNLPVYRDSTNAQVNYSVVETPVPTGYTSVVTNNGYEILVTNTHTPGPVDLSVTKAWDDGDNKDELRPESVTVQLLADGVVIDTVVLNAANNWTHSWTGMEASRNGRKIVYSVNEVPIPEKYTATVSSVETAKSRAFTIVNHYTPMPETTELSGTKIWVDQSDALGLRPDSIEVQLYQNGALLLGQTPEWAKEGNVWTYHFRDLPYADQDHKPYTYTVQETPVEGYRSEVNGTTIINTLLSREISISGTKTWRDNDNADGIRPTQITVRLLRDGVEIATKTVTAAEGWSYTFENLPESDPATGRIYQYQISEVLVNGYYMQTDGYNLINIELPRNNPGPGPEPGTGTRTYIVPGPGPGGTPVQPTVVIQDYEPPLGITQWGTPTEEELEDQVEIDEYKTPLWGELLQTGDDLPLYPFVSGGIGVLALLALLMDRKKRKNRQ